MNKSIRTETSVHKEAATPVEPLAVSIADAEILMGLNYRTIYRELSAGRLIAVKSGRKTLIPMDSIKAYMAALPPAKFGQKQAA